MKQFFRRIKLALRVLKGDAQVVPKEGIGDFSDGYHTFNELYHHRAVLFSFVCNSMPRNFSWKSMRHHDGTMHDGMFIVGVETPHGPATYHYDVDPYWNLFHTQELPTAPEWDGHTPDEAIRRLTLFSQDVALWAQQVAREEKQ